MSKDNRGVYSVCSVKSQEQRTETRVESTKRLAIQPAVSIIDMADEREATRPINLLSYFSQKLGCGIIATGLALPFGEKKLQRLTPHSKEKQKNPECDSKLQSVKSNLWSRLQRLKEKISFADSALQRLIRKKTLEPKFSLGAARRNVFFSTTLIEKRIFSLGASRRKYKNTTR